MSALRRSRPNERTKLRSEVERDDDETRRLAELDSYDVMGTAPEPAFDRVAELARALFQAPVGVITFVGRERNWVKAKAGRNATELAREVSFCQHVIGQTVPLVVPDASRDVRFAKNPFVVGEPHIRFYAGAPLCTPAGYRLGAVCVTSPQPRAGMDATDRERLTALAAIAANELELRRQLALVQQLASERDLLRRELEHRAESGLRLVLSVLEAQAARLDKRRPDDRRARLMLLAAIDRIDRLEMMHRQIRGSAASPGTDARGYLLALIGNLQDIGLDDGDARSISLSLSPGLAIPPDRLASVGIVLAELMIDALLRGQGGVRIGVDRQGQTLIVTASHDGAGYVDAPELMIPPDRSSLRLVTELALPDGVAIDPERPDEVVVRMRG